MKRNNQKQTPQTGDGHGKRDAAMGDSSGRRQPSTSNLVHSVEVLPPSHQQAMQKRSGSIAGGDVKKVAKSKMQQVPQNHLTRNVDRNFDEPPKQRQLMQQQPTISSGKPAMKINLSKASKGGSGKSTTKDKSITVSTAGAKDMPQVGTKRVKKPVQTPHGTKRVKDSAGEVVEIVPISSQISSPVGLEIKKMEQHSKSSKLSTHKKSIDAFGSHGGSAATESVVASKMKKSSSLQQDTKQVSSSGGKVLSSKMQQPQPLQKQSSSRSQDRTVVSNKARKTGIIDEKASKTTQGNVKVTIASRKKDKDTHHHPNTTAAAPKSHKRVKLSPHRGSTTLYDEQSSFQGVKQAAMETHVCHCSFKALQYPDEKKFLTRGEQQSDTQEEFAQFYQLIYCVDCCVPVYRMCLGEDELVEEVKMADGKDYLVFKCQRCRENARDQKCLECERYDGYMTMVSLQSDSFISKANNQVDLTEQPSQCETAWVHPICAMSFPKIYQMTSPSTMTFKLCRGVNAATIYQLSNENHNLKSCCLCNGETVRALTTSQDLENGSDEETRYAHAYCLYYSTMPTTFAVDLKQDYQFEETTGAKQAWLAQLLFTDTFDESSSTFSKAHSNLSGHANLTTTKKESKHGKLKREVLDQQSPFMRVYSDLNKQTAKICICERAQNIGGGGLMQCAGCCNWYHQDCWGSHVDLTDNAATTDNGYVMPSGQVGPSQSYLAEVDRRQKDRQERENLKILSGAVSNEPKNKADAAMDKESNHEDSQEDEEMSHSEEGEHEQNESDIVSRKNEQDFLLCEKCLRISRLTRTCNDELGEGELADIILGKKSIDNYLTNKYQCEATGQLWSTAKTMQSIWPDYDLRTMDTWELTIFEHYMLYRFWYKILEQAVDRKLSAALYKDLLAKQQVHMINCQDLELLIQDKLASEKKLSTVSDVNFREESNKYFFKEIFSLDTNELNIDNVNFNAQGRERLQIFIQEHLSSAPLITDETTIFFDRLLEANCMMQIVSIYQQDHVEAEDVRQLLIKLRQLTNFGHSQSPSFKKLETDLKVFDTWANKTTRMLLQAKSALPASKILSKFKEYKDMERAPDKLSQMQVEYLKTLFGSKITLSQVQQLADQASKSHIQSAELSRILQVNMEAECQFQMDVCTQQDKPVKWIRDNLINTAANLLIKPFDLGKQLSTLQKVIKLRLETKDFLCDQIVNNVYWLLRVFREEGWNMNEIEKEKRKPVAKRQKLRDRWRSFVWTSAQITMLFVQLGATTDHGSLIDAKLRQQAIEKKDKIEELKGKQFEQICSSHCTMDQLQAFIRSVFEFENVDLDNCLEAAKTKLSIMRVSHRCLSSNAAEAQNEQRKMKSPAPTSKSQRDSVTSPAVDQQSSSQMLHDMANIQRVLMSQNQFSSSHADVTSKQAVRDFEVSNVSNEVGEGVAISNLQESQVANSEALNSSNPLNSNILDILESDFRSQSRLSQQNLMLSQQKFGAKLGQNNKQQSATKLARDLNVPQQNDESSRSFCEIDQQNLMKAIEICESTKQMYMPEELKLELQSKIQIEKQLKEQFARIANNNQDNFNAQMMADLKKCVMQAWKDHGVRMNEERRIVDNLRPSEQWFEATYLRLKNSVFGAQALVDIDCMDYKQILEMLEEPKEVVNPKAAAGNSQVGQLLLLCQDADSRARALGVNPISGQPDQLVLAAFNLNLSLQRCQWMISVQRMLGIGKFSGMKHQEVDEAEREKNLQQVSELCQQITALGLEDQVISDQHASEDDKAIFKMMGKLSNVVMQFHMFFGTNMTDQDACLAKVSKTIQKCEQQREIVASLDAIKSAIQELELRLQDLNVTSAAMDLGSLLNQACQHIDFARSYNEMKEQKGLGGKKLKIDDCQQLLNEFNKRCKRGASQDQAYTVIKLKKSIAKFEKFRLSYQQYHKFKARLRLQVKESEEECEQNGQPEEGIAREQGDLRYTYDFVQSLIADANDMDIDINEVKRDDKEEQKDDEARFDIESLKQDLADYDAFKSEFIKLMGQMESEIFEKQTQQSIVDLKESGKLDQFQSMRIKISKLPIYDKQTYKKIQVFVWLLDAYELLDKGNVPANSPFSVVQDRGNASFMSIKQYKDFLKVHKNFVSLYPDIATHSIIHQLNWEVQKAQSTIDEVRLIKSLVSSLNQLWIKGMDYFTQHFWRFVDGQKQFEDFQAENRMANMPKLQEGRIVMGSGAQHDQNGARGQIGPDVSKERLITQFKKKYSLQHFEKLLEQAVSIKVDLAEELRILQKHTTFYQSYCKSSVIEDKNYKELKTLAKDIFLSPIYNYSSFANLKKRLELASSIGEDLKYVLRDLDGDKKVSVTRLSAYLDHWKASSGIKGVAEIDLSFTILKQAGEDLKKVADQLESILRDNKEISVTELEALEIQLKTKYTQVQIDFTIPPEELSSCSGESKRLSKMENQVQASFWLIDVYSLQKSTDAKMDYYRFKSLMNRYDIVKSFQFDEELKEKGEQDCPEDSPMKQPMFIDKDEQLKYFESLRDDVQEVLKSLQEATTLQAVEDLWTKHQTQVNKEVPKWLVRGLIDVRQTVQDRIVKIKSGKLTPLRRANDESDSSSSSGSDSDSSSSGSSSSGSESGEAEQQDLDSASSGLSFASSPEGSLSDGLENLNQEERAIYMQKRKREKKALRKKYEEQKFQEQKETMQGKSSQGGAAQSLLLGPGMNTQDVDDIKQDFQNSQRQNSKNVIRQFLLQVLEICDKKLEKQALADIVNSIEGKCFEIADRKVFDKYRFKVQSVRRNIEFLVSKVKEEKKDSENFNDVELIHADIVHRMLIQKEINPTRLSQEHVQFLKDVKIIEKKLREAKRVNKEKQIRLAEQEQKKPKARPVVDPTTRYINKIEDDTKKMQEESAAEKAKRQLELLQEEKKRRMANVVGKTPQQAATNLDDEESGEFSDVEPTDKPQQKVTAPTEPFKAPKMTYNPMNTLRRISQKQAMILAGGNQPGLHASRAIMFEQGNVVGANPLADSSQKLQQPLIEPILYDPLLKKTYEELRQQVDSNDHTYISEKRMTQQKKRFVDHSQQLNYAPPGALLKIWSGHLDMLTMHQQRASKRYAYSTRPVFKRPLQLMGLDLFSNQDIKLYQSLPDLAPPSQIDLAENALQLRGKANISEVTSRFMQLEREGLKFLKGYAIPCLPDEQNDTNPGCLQKASKQVVQSMVGQYFQDMRQQNQAYFFKLYDGIRLQQNQPNQGGASTVIKEVQLYIMPICSQTLRFCQQSGIMPPVDSEHSKAPYAFAYLINVSKHASYSLQEKCLLTKSSMPSLNPEQFIAQGNVKNEIGLAGNASDVHMSSATEEDMEIDRLIYHLRQMPTQNYDEIMRALEPYVGGQRVSEASEAKLTRFIEELIEQKQREPQMLRERPPIPIHNVAPPQQQQLAPAPPPLSQFSQGGFGGQQFSGQFMPPMPNSFGQAPAPLDDFQFHPSGNFGGMPPAPPTGYPGFLPQLRQPQQFDAGAGAHMFGAPPPHPGQQPNMIFQQQMQLPQNLMQQQINPLQKNHQGGPNQGYYGGSQGGQ